MMPLQLFGTDGIRGRAGAFPLNRDTIVAIGRALGEKLHGDILVGQDTRLSSPWIFSLLNEGIRNAGARVIDVGVLPTPAVALLTANTSHSGGIMISASHNPFEDNGIKVFSANGQKLGDQDEKEVERRVEAMLGGSSMDDSEIPAASVSASNETEWPQQYLRLLESRFPEGRWLAGTRILLDCANGAMSEVAPQILRRLGADVQVIFGAPNGVNINTHCGAVHTESLERAVRAGDVDLGVAFDGDGDRAMFVSEKGRMLDGDAVLLLLVRYLDRRSELSPRTVVGTLMTNFALEKALQSEQIELKRVGVGDRFVFEEMMRSGALIGGEPSGHVIFSDFRLSGDGLLTTLKVLEVMKRESRGLDELTADWTRAPQLLRNVKVRDRRPIESIPEVRQTLADAEGRLKGRGRMVVRYSGTEPLLRVMLESDSDALNHELMGEILSVTSAHLS